MAVIKTTAGVLSEEAYADMIKNIVQVFRCSEGDICNFEAIQTGLSNIIIKFSIKGTGKGEFVYRSPGFESELLTDRGREAIVQSVVSSSGIDSTIIAMDAEKGWRISRYIKHRDFDYHDINDMVRGIMLIRQIHEIPCKVRWNFDVIKEAEHIKQLTPREKYGHFSDFERIRLDCYKLYDLTKNDSVAPCVIHGDCRDVNFLINDDECYLIDWEWGGFGDPGFDIGSYICGGLHSQEEVDRVLYTYLRKPPSMGEKRHYYAYIALTGWFYMNWTMLKESQGRSIGILKDYWYSYAKKYSKMALEMYGVD